MRMLVAYTFALGNLMETSDLTAKRCQPCEGGVPTLSTHQIAEHLPAVPDWNLVDDQSIERKWKLKNFVQALQFMQRIGELAEAEQHHPDLHLTGYRHVRVVLTTHAIGGLSENDFIIAAKIDAMDDDAS